MDHAEVGEKRRNAKVAKDAKRGPIALAWSLGLLVIASITYGLGSSVDRRANGGQPGGVVLAPRFVAGESVTYTVEAKFTRRRADNEQAPGTRLTQSAALTFVTGTERRGGEGGAVVRATFDRLSTRIERLGDGSEPTVWEWTRAGGEPTTKGPEVAGLAESNLALVRSTILIEVGVDGSVESLDGIDRAYEALAESLREGEGPGTPVLGVFSPGAVVTFFEGFWSLSDGVEAPRPAPGESWDVRRSAPLFGGYEAEARTRYTLARIRDDVAEITGTMSFALVEPHIAPDPVAPMPRILRQSGRVEVDWDTASRRVVRRLSERSLDWGATIALKEPLERRDYTTARVELKLDPAR